MTEMTDGSIDEILINENIEKMDVETDELFMQQESDESIELTATFLANLRNNYRHHTPDMQTNQKPLPHPTNDQNNTAFTNSHASYPYQSHHNSLNSNYPNTHNFKPQNSTLPDDESKHFAKAFESTVNTGSKKKLAALFNDNCLDGCDVSLIYPHAMNPLETKYVEVRGVNAVVNFIAKEFQAVPDGVVCIKESKMWHTNATSSSHAPKHSSKQNKNAIILCSYVFCGSRIGYVNVESGCSEQKGDSSDSEHSSGNSNNSSSSNINSNKNNSNNNRINHNSSNSMTTSNTTNRRAPSSSLLGLRNHVACVYTNQDRYLFVPALSFYADLNYFRNLQPYGDIPSGNLQPFAESKGEDAELGKRQRMVTYSEAIAQDNRYLNLPCRQSNNASYGTSNTSSSSSSGVGSTVFGGNCVAYNKKDHKENLSRLSARQLLTETQRELNQTAVSSSPAVAALLPASAAGNVNVVGTIKFYINSNKKIYKLECINSFVW